MVVTMRVIVRIDTRRVDLHRSAMTVMVRARRWRGAIVIARCGAAMDHMQRMVQVPVVRMSGTEHHISDGYPDAGVRAMGFGCWSQRKTQR